MRKPTRQQDEREAKPLTRFVTYLNEHCIGQTITEESLTDWMLDVMDNTPREEPKHPQKSKGLFASSAQQVQADAGAVSWRRVAYPDDVCVTKVERDAWLEEGWEVEALYTHPSPAGESGEPMEFQIQVAGPAGYVRFETFHGETLDDALECVRRQRFATVPDEDGFVTMKVKV